MKSRLTQIRIWLVICVFFAGVITLDNYWGTKLYVTQVVDHADINTMLSYNCESWEQAYARELQLSTDDENMFVGRKPMFIFHKWLSCQTL